MRFNISKFRNKAMAVIRTGVFILLVWGKGSESIGGWFSECPCMEDLKVPFFAQNHISILIPPSPAICFPMQGESSWEGDFLAEKWQKGEELN